MKEIRKVVQSILSNFLIEEQGNRVTKNNMQALMINVNHAFDGNITLTPPKDKGEDEPGKE
jgi:hypothetical protein